MKRIGVLILVILFSFGTVALMSGCLNGDGDGDGNGLDDALPQSTPDYAGSSNPAVIDSSTAVDFLQLPAGFESITEIISDLNFLAVMETTEVIEGNISGTATFWAYMDTLISDTLDSWRFIESITFENFADTTEGTLVASGRVWFEGRYEVTYDGEEIVAEGVGAMLTSSELFHMDFDAFSYSTDTANEERSGYMTMGFNESYVDSTWDMAYAADIAMADYAGTPAYLGILGADSTLAWDGSTTDFTANGTICAEGNLDYPVLGCVVFSIDYFWAENTDGEMGTTFPAGGAMEISAYAGTALDASALFAFASSASDPTCFDLSVDANGDGDYVDKGDLDAVEVCGETWPGSTPP
jgi:hypothetical protein